MVRKFSDIYLIVTLSTMLALGVQDETPMCRQWCVTSENKKCSEDYECSIRPDVIETGRFTGKPRPQAKRLHLSPECYEQKEKRRIGLRISWDITGAYLSRAEVTDFYLVIRDLDSHSSVSSISVLITPNDTMGREHYAHFDYFYGGSNSDEGPEIVENERYSVTLESVPIFWEEPTPDNSTGIKTRMLKKMEKLPINYKRDVCTPTTASTTTSSTTAKPPRYLTLVVVASVITVIVLVVVIFGIAAFKWKRADSAANSARAQNILILLNVEDRAEVAKQTNWTATALSRANGLGELSVKYNRWETTEIAEIGIARWMREKVTWAHKVIISSTPDELRNDESSHIFEKAFDNIMLEHSVTESSDEKPVFVVHFQQEEYHRRCPYMANDQYRKFFLEEEWTNLCRSISASPGGEQEPLQNGSIV